MAKRPNPRVFAIHKALYGKDHPDQPTDKRKSLSDQFTDELSALVGHYAERGVSPLKIQAILRSMIDISRRRETLERQEALTEQMIEHFASLFLDSAAATRQVEPEARQRVLTLGELAARIGMAERVAFTQTDRIAAHTGRITRSEPNIQEVRPFRMIEPTWVGFDFASDRQSEAERQRRAGIFNPHSNRPDNDAQVRGFQRGRRR